MRKIIVFFLLISLLNVACKQEQEQELKLPIVFHNSQSVHASGLSQLQNCNQVSDSSKFATQLKEYDNVRVGILKFIWLQLQVFGMKVLETTSIMRW